MTRVMTDCVITDMLRGNPAGIEIRSFHRESPSVRSSFCIRSISYVSFIFPFPDFSIQ